MRNQVSKKGAAEYLAINYITGKIFTVDFSGGRTHDSNLPLSERTCIIADKGY